MTTLISVGNSEGTRRCDASCYEAKGPDCDCVCGGRNHGKGLGQAQQNTTELGLAILAQDEFDHQLFKELDQPSQLSLLSDTIEQAMRARA